MWIFFGHFDPLPMGDGPFYKIRILHLANPLPLPCPHGSYEKIPKFDFW